MTEYTKEYITILCYSTQELVYKELTDEDMYLLECYGADALLKKYRYNIDECSWMFTDTQPVLEYLDK